MFYKTRLDSYRCRSLSLSGWLSLSLAFGFVGCQKTQKVSQPIAKATSELPPTDSPTPKQLRRDGPGFSKGPLSERFTEIEIRVETHFAHDHGDMDTIEELSVAGKPCSPQELVEALVSHRKGWSKTGGSSDQEVISTLENLKKDWRAVLEHSGVLTKEKAPEALNGLVSRLSYHPPKVALYVLSDGDKIATYSYFHSWDGGNHGRQYAYEVEAYRVSTGAAFDLKPPKADPLTGKRPEASGPQPVDPTIPRPERIRRY